MKSWFSRRNSECGSPISRASSLGCGPAARARFLVTNSHWRPWHPRRQARVSRCINWRAGLRFEREASGSSRFLSEFPRPGPPGARCTGRTHGRPGFSDAPVPSFQSAVAEARVASRERRHAHGVTRTEGRHLMDSFALWSWPAGLWFWPAVVCLCAWLFRRHVLSGNAGGFRLPARLPRCFTDAASFDSAAAKAISGSGGLREPSSVMAPDSMWRRLFGAVAKFRALDPGTETPASITVCARKTVGPQQQLAVIHAGNREYHILFQPAAPPLVLYAHSLSRPASRERDGRCASVFERRLSCASGSRPARLAAGRVGRRGLPGGSASARCPVPVDGAAR